MINTELLKGSMATLVLTALNRREMYGYDIMKDIERSSSNKILVKEGTLYPILHALEKDGAVKSSWVEKPGERKRKYYKITEVGKKLLKTRKAEWENFRQLIDTLLVASIKAV